MSSEVEARALLEESQQEILLSVKEYADVYRLTTTAVYTAIREGRCPHPVERPMGRAGTIRIRMPASILAGLRVSPDSLSAKP